VRKPVTQRGAEGVSDLTWVRGGGDFHISGSCGSGKKRAAQRGWHRGDASKGTSLLSKGGDGHGQAQHAADGYRQHVVWEGTDS
jgi:hypothetical protein